MYKGPSAKNDKSLQKWIQLRELEPYNYSNYMKKHIDPETQKPYKLYRVAMKIGHYVG